MGLKILLMLNVCNVFTRRFCKYKDDINRGPLAVSGHPCVNNISAIIRFLYSVR